MNIIHIHADATKFCSIWCLVNTSRSGLRHEECNVDCLYWETKRNKRVTLWHFSCLSLHRW